MLHKYLISFFFVQLYLLSLSFPLSRVLHSSFCCFLLCFIVLYLISLWPAHFFFFYYYYLLFWHFIAKMFYVYDFS